MPSKPFETLYAEHEVILAAIARLQALLAKPDLAPVADELKQLIAFFREYGDGYHHQKEENVLFPALLESNSSMGAMVESLTDHHQLFRDMLGEADASCAKGDWKMLERQLRTYAGDLVDHIGAENDELFVAAEDLLSDSDKERIGFQFEDADRELGAANKLALEAIAAQ